MWLLFIVALSIGIGIWKFPYINHTVRKNLVGNCRTDGACDGCKVCALACIASAFSVIFIPAMFVWKKVIKAGLKKVVEWQVNRVKKYNEGRKHVPQE